MLTTKIIEKGAIIIATQYGPLNPSEYSYASYEKFVNSLTAI